MIKETGIQGLRNRELSMVGRDKYPKDRTTAKKLSPRRYGPFEVVAKISHVAYRIVSLKHGESTTCFTRLSLRLTRRPTNMEPTSPRTTSRTDRRRGEWEVEQILGNATSARGKKLQYLVRWKDYSPAHAQWVDKSDITAEATGRNI